MQKIKVVALDRYRQPIVKELQKLGAVQLKDVRERLENPEWRNFMEEGHSSEHARKAIPILIKLDRILDIFSNYLPKQSALKSMTQPVPTLKVKDESPSKLLSSAESYVKELNTKVLSLNSKLDSLSSEKEELERLQVATDALAKIGLKPEHVGESKRLVTYAGYIDKEPFEEFKAEMAKISAEKALFNGVPYDEKKYVCYASVFKEHTDKLNQLIRKFNFEEMDIPYSKYSGNEIAKRVGEIEKEQQKLKAQLKGLASKWNSKLKALKEQLEIEKERGEAEGLMGKTKSTIFFEGWVPSKNADLVSKTVSKISQGRAFVKTVEPEEGEEPPVKLQNPGLAKPFEALTEMYALPKYHEIDPTFVMTPVLILFSGLMLTDFAYGLFLALIGLFVWKKVGKVDESIGSFGVIVTAVGISTMFFGVLTGSYFGDLPKYLFGLEPSQLALWIDPLTSPIALLTIALIMGLVHLNMGLIIGAYKNASAGKYFGALAEQGIWFMLQFAAFTLLGPMFGWGAPSSFMKYLAFGLIGISLLLILKTEGAIGLFSLTGFFGDVVSYSRILALALATGGIAMTMNLLAGMVAGTPYVGFLLAALIFTVGQLFSFAMNSLGAFIHGLRLHYVEFFSKFYEGGGAKFQPLELRRKYTTVE